MTLTATDSVTLLIAIAIAAGVATVLLRYESRELVRRGWIVAGILTLVLLAIGALDLFRRPWPDVKFSTVLIAALFTVLGTKAMVHATRRVRPWLRWLLAFVIALVMLFGGLLTGATGVSRLLPF
jgi:uncharacterized membrane protein HdeD (DUF308 family)